jgi:hypothetical protein
MKIIELIKLEESNSGILLHKEGIFWRAYERSAYRFVNHLTAYRVQLRYYKNIKQDVVYIGYRLGRSQWLLTQQW